MCQTKNLTKCKIIEQQFKTYKNNLLKLTRAGKFNHYNNYFQDNRLNLFKTWEGIRDIINITKKPKNNINSIQVNGKDITDPAIITNEFNNHFTTIDELSKPISLLANISLHTSMFPNILKTANVTPIFKRDDPALCKNYQPISLLSNVSKIFEKIIHGRLSIFLSTNNILYEKRFGF